MYYVYKLNCDDGIYVGKTVNLETRLYEHMTIKATSNHPFNSYEVLYETESEKTAFIKEEEFRQKYKANLNKNKSGLKTHNMPRYWREYRKNRSVEQRESDLEKARERNNRLNRGSKIMFDTVPNPLEFGICYRRMFSSTVSKRKSIISKRVS